jgi:hypothetical protein
MKTPEVKSHIAGKTASGKVDFLLSLNESNNLKIAKLRNSLKNTLAALVDWMDIAEKCDQRQGDYDAKKQAEEVLEETR